ncbi:multidrug resistance-associated ABC transporter [Flagelloscypha sp. PMI_526]|nr:multidrug resistance-associated ABC transporter [Flagelloscypha sp. PMI_526]
MRQSDLWLSIELTIAAFLSTIFLLLSKWRDEKPGRIQLPEHAEPLVDRFDVLESEDLVEGYPIDADLSWKRVSTFTLHYSNEISYVFRFEPTEFGQLASALIVNNGNTREIISDALRIYFASYTMAVSIRLVREENGPLGSSLTFHLSSLLTLATLSLILLHIVVPEEEKSFSQSSLQTYLQLVTLLAYMLTTALAISLSREKFFGGLAVKSTTREDPDNVSGRSYGSFLSVALFSYTQKVVDIAAEAGSVEIGDLPIVPLRVRAPYNYRALSQSIRRLTKPGTGWRLGWVLFSTNKVLFLTIIALSIVSGGLFYAPSFALRQAIKFIEEDPERTNMHWGWVTVAAVFFTTLIMFLVTCQLWAINMLLYQKTLTRKNFASSITTNTAHKPENGEVLDQEKNSSDTKGQIFNLFTTDTERLSFMSWHTFILIDTPIELLVGGYFLVQLLGVSAVYGFAVMAIFMPINQWAGKLGIRTQDSLMQTRDTRVALMNEILGSIRMLKFMAWERSFENKVLGIRSTELMYQRRTFLIKISPVFVAIACFSHFTLVRGMVLTPSIAELKFAFNLLPDVVVKLIECAVSLRRLDAFLASEDIVTPVQGSTDMIAFQSCSLSWPRSPNQDPTQTPQSSFVLHDLNISFPLGSLSLICGRLGSGKTLILNALLGEADVLSGQVICPRSPPNTLTSLSTLPANDEPWLVDGLCAYVPQTAWLRNASIRDNICFDIPFQEQRYQQTLEACALLSDLAIFEDGDQAEIGERGINLSGGQKARVSLARAVYSLLLDDVLSAVDAHTANHLFSKCLKGDLMTGRTIILVSHHIQLCAPGASYVVVLDNGRTSFAGEGSAFVDSPVMKSLSKTQDEGLEEQETNDEPTLGAPEATIENLAEKEATGAENGNAKEKKTPRKYTPDEERAVGRVARSVYQLYLTSLGGMRYWITFTVVYGLAAISPIAATSWLRYWSDLSLRGEEVHDVSYYLGIYAAISLIGVTVECLRFLVLYEGSIVASKSLYKKLLEAILFANIRFHDTVSRGRVLNRFGKDFEGIDDSLANNIGQTFIFGTTLMISAIVVSIVGGPIMFVTITLLAFIYYSGKDMRRLDSVSRSPLYSMFNETIAGVTVIRAFGASSKFLKDIMRLLNTNLSPQYWSWGLNLWLMIRFDILSTFVLTLATALCVSSKTMDAAYSGFILFFALRIVHDFVGVFGKFIGLCICYLTDQDGQVALERVKEYSELPSEGPEFIEPRPDDNWPEHGHIQCQNVSIRYAADLPDVLHEVSFEVSPGEKVGILGRTGSGKSTLAFSLLRFVDPTEGRIIVDGHDIAKVGFSDLRSRLTIIPQDPSILSGTLRNTLDVFGEYDDATLFEALRRVHLIPSDSGTDDEANLNVFRNLDSVVSEGGENFSTGEKQLICMARAVLRQSKILIMDEATASVDYATDELISQTIRQEFKTSTILTIAHRLRTILLLDHVPATLLKDSSSQFYALCKATGPKEFSVLKRLAGA